MRSQVTGRWRDGRRQRNGVVFRRTTEVDSRQQVTEISTSVINNQQLEKPERDGSIVTPDGLKNAIRRCSYSLSVADGNSRRRCG